jgi:hypothetical protein
MRNEQNGVLFYIIYIINNSDNSVHISNMHMIKQLNVFCKSEYGLKHVETLKRNASSITKLN